MNTYRIEPADGTVPLSGDPEAGQWSRANRLVIGEYPWSDDDGPAATGRLLYDTDALYLQFRVADDHIQAAEREHNGDVWRDSCVELFASPWSDRPDYVNFEANCVGQFLLGYGPDRHERRLVDPGATDDFRVETSVSGTRKEPSPEDESWWLAAALPFETLGDFVGSDVTPSTGTDWRGNAYCCRGEPEPRHVTWSPIDVAEPDFHRPESFGRFTYG